MLIELINTLGYAYAWNLPFGTNTSTCLDTNWETGCPTTRFENKYDNTSWIKDDDFQIEDIEQCAFNAYLIIHQNLILMEETI